jgi:hypothetical protein
MSRKVIQVSSKYVDKKTGAEKWRNANVGTAFVYENGDIALLIDPGISIACSDGVRIALKEPFERDTQRPHGKPQRGGLGDGDGNGGASDDLPF